MYSQHSLCCKHSANIDQYFLIFFIMARTACGFRYEKFVVLKIIFCTRLDILMKINLVVYILMS